MARSLFKLASFFTPTRILTLRLRSTLPEALETVAATKEEAERVAMKKLEEAVHRIIVKRAEPGWLPLVPGGSYWVPPKAKARGFADVVHKLLKDSTNVTDHALELCSTRAWPSSPHFFKGASNSPLEGEMTTSAIKTEEEEG